MAETRLEHCDSEDAECCDTCRRVNQNGVYYRAVEGTKFCSRHGADSASNAVKLEAANMYRLQKWNARIRQFTQADGVKSLREEVGILRVLLEEMINRCETPDKLMMFSARIANLTQDIGRLVVSCDRLERSMGQNMDKPTALKFAAKVVEIIGRYVEDAEALDNISRDILEELK